MFKFICASERYCVGAKIPLSQFRYMGTMTLLTKRMTKALPRVQETWGNRHGLNGLKWPTDLSNIICSLNRLCHRL